MTTKAIVNEDVFSSFKKGHLYAKKHEPIEILDIRDHVAIVQTKNKNWFPVDIKKLTIIQ